MTLFSGLPITERGDMTYLNLMDKLMSRSVMSETQELLTTLGVDNLVKPREFLIAFAVAWFPAEFMEMTPQEERDKISLTAQELLQSFNLYLNKYNNGFKDNLLKFIQVFSLWKEQDVIRWRKSLLNSYREAHHSQLIIAKMEHEFVERWLTDIKTLKDNIRGKIIS